jgi:UDP-N-acetylglucosamine--N-acetylmuramyl-(pentapeptide) pyrophosphoryl-undecaprenol N-acetylglucosamine transferase
MTGGERTPLTVVIAGGGTGGHLYPGIAVARELLARVPDARVSFAGTAQGIEARVVPREGFALDRIRSGGLKGKSLAARARGVALLPLGGGDAWRLLSNRRPHVVIGVGGYSSGPVVALAALRGIPTLLLEQNAVPGLTNRLLAPLVRAAAVTYDVTLPFFKGKGFVSGNPVRSTFFESDRVDAHDAPTAPVGVLIFGGSQGAHAINVAAVEAAPELARADTRLAVTHQTGERDLEMVRAGYRRAGLAARVEPFLYEMDREVKAAQVIVCRAGATTLAEITAASRGALLVPLPTATDDHQRKNADVLARAGAAEVIDQRELTGARLAAAVVALAHDADRRARMGAAARALARPHAAREIVDRVLALARHPAGAQGAPG